MNELPVRYATDRDDSARWRELAMRPGDIVVSAPAKAGTTWLQTICGLLVFQRPELPARLDALSPWVDMKMVPIAVVGAQLEAQGHRRFIKTHTPLDGLPLRDDVSYLVGARHPLDVAVSTYHQWRNIDLDAVRAALGVTTAEMPDPADVPLTDWLSAWIHEELADPRTDPHSLQAVLRHLADAWERRAAPNVALVHYADLSADLDGEMRRVAGFLAIDVPGAVWPELVEAATFARMRSRAEDLAPRVVPFKDRDAFFRTGRSGAGLESVSEADLARFHARVEAHLPRDLAEWLCRP